MSKPQILPLAIKDLHFAYERNAVLRGVSCEIAAGEVVAILGANGAGKTTLFSILMGLLQPSRGRLSFAGEECEEVDLSKRAKMAYLPHMPQLYPLLSAVENLEFFAAMMGAAGLATLEIRPMLARLGLEEVADRPVSTFSRGMAQRVMLARALTMQPDLYIFDEPFTALDRSGKNLLKEIFRAERNRGAAILLASHDMAVVAEVVDRALLLERGCIAEEKVRSAQGFSDTFLGQAASS